MTRLNDRRALPGGTQPNHSPTLHLRPGAPVHYPAHHLRMAYAMAHANPPPEPYKVSGWDRQMVKWAVLIMRCNPSRILWAEVP
jgi:hypothetical protein